MPSTPLYSLPTDNKSPGATWSAPAGTVDTSFPLTNQNTVYPTDVTKFTGSTGTLRGTTASIAIQGILILNASRTLAGTTATVTNGGGMPSQNISIPTAPADNLGINAFKDLRSVTTASTTWDIAFSASGAFGAKVILLAALRDLPALYGTQPRPTKPTLIFRSHYGVARGSRKNVFLRIVTLRFTRGSFYAEYATLRRSSEGPTQPFAVILEPGASGPNGNPIWGWFPDDSWDPALDERAASKGTSVITWTDRIEEHNPGLGY